jgi:hypothetical protein
MLNTDRFAKVLALAGSNMDGEALAALRKARVMLADAGLSFIDLALSIGKAGGHPGHSGEVERLRRQLVLAEVDLDVCRKEIEDYKQQLKQLQCERSRAGSATNLRRSLAAIETRMRAVLGDARLSKLSDRELARRSGMSPQAVGNWRRRLVAERAAAQRGVHSGQRSRSRLRRSSS